MVQKTVEFLELQAVLQVLACKAYTKYVIKIKNLNVLHIIILYAFTYFTFVKLNS